MDESGGDLESDGQKKKSQSETDAEDDSGKD